MATKIIKKARLSVTVEPELKTAAQEIAKERNTTPSGVISQCLQELAHNRREESMIKYYKTMANEHDEYAKESAKVIQKIASAWSD